MTYNDPQRPMLGNLPCWLGTSIPLPLISFVPREGGGWGCWLMVGARHQVRVCGLSEIEETLVAWALDPEGLARSWGYQPPKAREDAETGDWI